MNFKRLQTNQNALSLQTIITINIIATAITASALASLIIYFNLRQNLEEQFSQRVLNLVTLAALTQQGDLHSTLKSHQDQTSNNYDEISHKNLEILNVDPIINAVYTMRQDEKKNIYFVVYNRKNNLSESNKTNPNLGEIFKDAGPLLKQEFTTLNIAKIEETTYTNQWGTWVSAYSPFYKGDNLTREGIIGINVNKNELINTENNTLMIIFGMFILLIPILIVVGRALSIHIVKPINNITNNITKVSSENIGEYTLNSNSDNEIDQLNQAINNMLARINISFQEAQDGLAKNADRWKEYEKELEKNKKQAKKLSNQLNTLAFVGRAILSIPNLDNLLPRIAITTSDTLSFYHIGIFLLDDAKEYAILTATNSPGGQKMIERNHRLKVGEQGIVGYTAGVPRPRIAFDTDKDATFLTNPDLPETHSELAMPLKIGGNTIGVLDIQSKEYSAFSEEDIDFFSTLCDYISIAIQNTQRYQEIQKTITESDTLYRNYLRQEWKSFTSQRRNLGYLYNVSGSKPITKKSETADIQKAVQSGKPTISQEKSQSYLSVPIKLRGQVIGILNIQSGGNHDWEDDEIDIATAIADRVGLAVENARLLEDSQSRAARERTISEITSKIGASINIRNVLQTAVEELGHILPGSDVIIQLKDTKNKE